MNLKKVRVGQPGLVASLVFSLSILSLRDVAHAHIRMDEPIARNVWAASAFADPIKQGPCGSGANDPRTSDPNKINTFAPGETITVSWHETIAHPSHYRISIDMDGHDDFVDPVNAQDIVDPPVLPILLDGIEDPSGMADTFSVQVTLPNETCENCTLQLIQYMYDSNESYYVCADLVIAGTPVGGDGDGDTASGGAPSGDGDTGAIDTGSGGGLIASSGGSLASGGQLSTGGAIGTGEQPGSGGAANMGAGAGTDEPTDTANNDDGANTKAPGCSIPRHGYASAASDWTLFLPWAAVLSLLRRRRRVIT